MDNISKENSESIRKARQAIVYGSPYEALIKDFVTCEDILNYLLYNNLSFKGMIAYRAVCQFSKDQIVKGNSNPDFNDRPFITLTKHDEYVGIYNLSIGITGNMFGRTDQERVEIAKRTQKVWPRLVNVNSFSRTIHLICDSSGQELDITPTEMWLIVGARSIKLITNVFRKLLPHFEVWIDNDYLEPLEHIEYNKYEGTLLDRCEMLKKSAPQYWNMIGTDLYSEIVTKNINVKDPRMNRKQISRYVKLFPGMFPDDLVNMTDLVYNIKELPEIVQSYVLGYPIHLYVPSKEIIQKTIELVDSLGIDEYVKTIEEKNQKSMINHIDMINPLGLEDEISVSNETDVMMENICSYNNFDIIRYYIDTHVYFFTRPEFPDLVSKKKNVWTNSQIPVSVLSEINSRLEMSVLCKLPKSMPLRDLLKKVREGTLYLIPEAPAVPTEPPLRIQPNQNNHNLLFDNIPFWGTSTNQDELNNILDEFVQSFGLIEFSGNNQVNTNNIPPPVRPNINTSPSNNIEQIGLEMLEHFRNSHDIDLVSDGNIINNLFEAPPFSSSEEQTDESMYSDNEEEQTDESVYSDNEEEQTDGSIV